MVVATEVLAITAGPCSADPTEGAGWRVNFAGSGGRALPAADPGPNPGRLDNPHPGALCLCDPRLPDLSARRAISRAQSPPPPVARPRWHPHDPSPPP